MSDQPDRPATGATELRERITEAIRSVDRETITSDGYVDAFTNAVIAVIDAGRGLTAEQRADLATVLGVAWAWARDLDYPRQPEYEITSAVERLRALAAGVLS